MHLHRLSTVAIAAGTLVACSPSITKHENPASTDYVLFDPSVSQIPLPNDLALSPTAIAAATGAQKELLQSLAAAKGFPSDQGLQVTIDVQRYTYGGSEPQKGPPPTPLDRATLTPASVIVADITDKTKPAFLVQGKDIEARYAVAAAGDRGTLYLRRAADPATGSRRWQAGHQYAVLLRGGAAGAKLQGGGPLTAMPTMFLLTRGVDLSLPQNEYLLPGDGRAGRAATGAQLEALRQSYLPLFGLADGVWGPGASQDLLSVQTFQIAPSAGTAVAIDSVLPSDLLLDPVGGKVVNSPDAFCDWSPSATDPSTKLDDAGSCTRAAAFATLDGFSTTAMHLIGTTLPVKASTVTSDSVLLYEVGAAGLTRVPDVRDQVVSPTTAVASYLTQPPQVACPAGAGLPADCAPAIALQPGVPVPLSSTTTLTLPPLKEGTQYVVVVTSRVQDVTGKPLVRSAFTNLLFFQNPLADLGSGKSLVSSLSDAQAVGIEKARSTLLPPLLAKIQADKGITPDQVVTAYTVKTQTIAGTALKLAAAPYQQAAAIVPQPPKVYATFADVEAAYPAPPTFPISFISSPTHIQEWLDVPVPTLNAISNTTGALEPDSSKWVPSLVTAIVVVPKPALVTTPCPGTSGLKCAPLVVFHHGFNDRRSDVLAIADALAGQGFVVASIDAPYHGDRTPCASNADCAVGTCVPIPGGAGQGDQAPPLPPPGLCTNADGTPGKPLPSITGQRYFISGNLFRTRDALRQDIIDQSSLVLALARPPSLPQVTSPVATRLGATYGLAVDPSKVYWVGPSLGAIQGTTNVAVNSRFSKAVLNVGGATIVDTLLNSPAYSGRTDPTTPPTATSMVGLLLASQKITFGTAGYLQFVNVAKWVLDPAEPLNFATHLVAAPLPDPLSSAGAAQPAKNVLGQIAIGDQTIANPQSFELYGNIFGPLPSPNVPTYSSTSGGNPHGFLLDFANPAMTQAAQSNAADFLTAGTPPPATQSF